MGRRLMVCVFALVAFSATAAHGHHGQSVISGATAATVRTAAVAITPRAGQGARAAPIPISTAIFYLPGTREACNPGPQDAEKVGSSR